jgi:hypothetical protein
MIADEWMFKRMFTWERQSGNGQRADDLHREDAAARKYRSESRSSNADET